MADLFKVYKTNSSTFQGGVRATQEPTDNQTLIVSWLDNPLEKVCYRINNKIHWQRSMNDKTGTIFFVKDDVINSQTIDYIWKGRHVNQTTTVGYPLKFQATSAHSVPFNFTSNKGSNAAAILYNFIHRLSASEYNQIRTKKLSIICIAPKDMAICGSRNIHLIHRVTSITYTMYNILNQEYKDSPLSDNALYTAKGYSFYEDSSVTSGGVYFTNKHKYCVINKTGHSLANNPSSAQSALNAYKSKSNQSDYYIIQLKEQDDGQKYTTIKVSDLQDSTQDDNSPSSDFNDVIDITPSYVKQDLDSYSAVSLNYATNLNNWKLYFVPASDKRTNPNKQENEEKYLGRGIEQSKGYKKGDVTYFTPSNNTILGLKYSTSENIDLTTQEPLSTFTTKVDYDLQDFATQLDSYFHYTTSNVWSGKNDLYLPGRVAKNDSQGKEDNTNLLNIQETNYQYAVKRVPKVGAIIVNKKGWEAYNIDKIKEYKDLSKAVAVRTSFKNYFTSPAEIQKNYKILYYKIELIDFDLISAPTVSNSVIISESSIESFSDFLAQLKPTMRAGAMYSFNVETSIAQERTSINLYDFKLVEAYTRGHDFIQEDYTTVRPQERNPDDNWALQETSRLMSFDDNYFTYKYSGREISLPADTTFALIHEKDLLLESDVTLGESYGEQQYFIEAIKYKNEGNNQTLLPYFYKDTFKVKDFVKAIGETQYTEDDYEILTGKIDLLQCKYYKPDKATAANNWCDCSFDSKDDSCIHECIYQKLGKCPYRFQTEKHPRRIRTLEQSKSNRFNLIQELSKVFECYPQFYIEFDTNGRILLDENGRMKKHVFFMTEKGAEQYSGFRYEKNLSSISRTVDSNSLTTKMYVESVDSDLTDSGLCTIQTAEDNIGRNSYVLNFSYYTKKGLLNPIQTQRDVFGIEKGDLAFLPVIGQYNKKYDEYSNLIINMTNQEMSTLQASNEVAVTGIGTALEERKKVGQRLYQFKMTQTTERKGALITTITTKSYTTSDTYKTYLSKYREQAVILWGLVEQLFFSGDYFSYCTVDKEKGVIKNSTINYSNPSAANKDIKELIEKYKDTYCKGELFWRLTLEGFKDIDEDSTYEPPFTNWNDFKEKVVDVQEYQTNGSLGQYRSLYNQVKHWKLERAKVLNKINEISDKFYKIYEPYIKEGTWIDSNYLTDNEYYWAAEDVLEDSCKPKLTYNINVIDISPLVEYSDDYKFDLGDTTYLEDIDFFGVNEKTGLPNRQKVIISEITYSLDKPQENSITVQNYTSAFDDLFESISASVQSLTYNENTYKRSSNFTAKQYIQTDSLQGTLDMGDLTLIDANDNNIVLDESGTQGNAIDNASSQYKLSGEGLFFSTDGGTTWDLGVGPKGFNMDYAKFGSLDASKVQIVDGQYIYFLWDKNGINAYRNPATSTTGLVDFARFNRYGLSLVEKGNVRLRAGYEFRNNAGGNNVSGDYESESPLTNQNVGFYLYNDNGQPIFKTETQSDYADDTTDYTARLSLAGEMFITNKVLDNEDDGSVVASSSAKTLSNGYLIVQDSVANFLDSTIGDVLDQDLNSYYFAENSSSTYTVTPIYDNIQKKSIITVKLVRKENSKSVAMPYDYYIISTNPSLNEKPASTITQVEGTIIECSFVTNSEVTTPIALNAEDLANHKGDRTIELGGVQWSSAMISSYMSENYYKLNNQTYLIGSKSVFLCSDTNTSASVTVPAQGVQTVDISYYDINNLPSNSITTSLYKSTNGTENYNYWGTAIDSDTPISSTTSSVSTKEVGIFINNKVGFSNNSTINDISSIQGTTEEEQRTSKAVSGAERLFMIALRGDEGGSTEYNNIFSVLKNGNLYIGGKIRAGTGEALNVPGFAYIPDEVKITEPSLIMSNDGNMWVSWEKFFNLTSDGQLGNNSLQSVLNKIQQGIIDSGGNSGGSDSGSSSITKAGWYIPDPIID